MNWDQVCSFLIVVLAVCLLCLIFFFHKAVFWSDDEKVQGRDGKIYPLMTAWHPSDHLICLPWSFKVMAETLGCDWEGMWNISILNSQDKDQICLFLCIALFCLFVFSLFCIIWLMLVFEGKKVMGQEKGEYRTPITKFTLNYHSWYLNSFFLPFSERWQ